MKSRQWLFAALLFVIPLFAVSCTKNGAVETSQAQQARAEEGGESTHFTLLHVADLHGQLEEHPELFWNDAGERVEIAGGFARVAEAIAHEREQAEGEVIAVDGGDTIQGSGAAALTKGEAMVEPLRALGLDLAIPGNWEVAYGPAIMKERMDALSYPVIAENIRDRSTGERVFEPTKVFERDGVKVGFIGFTDPDVPVRQPPAYSRGLAYDDASSLNERARELRDEQGADVVVLVSHLGLSKAVQLTQSLEGVDFHLSGDTHERTYEPIQVGDAWVVEPGAFGSFLGRLRFEVQDGEIVSRNWELLELTESNYGKSAEVEQLVERELAPLREELETVVGHTHDRLERYRVVDTSLDRLLADALRAQTGTDIAISNGFRFGTPVLPGPIREKDLWGFYPIVTRLKTGKVTGEQLRAFWERELENVFADNPSEQFGGWVPRPSGMTVRFKADAPFGERVQSIAVNGERLDDERVYSITACEREGDEFSTLCRIPNATDVEVKTMDAHDAVRSFLAAQEEVVTPDERRVEAVDLPEVLRSQALDTALPSDIREWLERQRAN
jgi:2',3'-cyclic-nucleotide 2'-phosphodiesterase (5'-nucleotidase family)